MASCSKFDMSSSNPDRPLYPSGQRGSHLVSHLERSGSFRDSVESPIVSSLPNMARSTPAVSQGDIVNFFQCLRFNPKVVAAEHKSIRQGDLKGHMDIMLGVSVDDSGFPKGKMSTSGIPEEVKRVKAGLRESSVKARERVKIFNEALSVFNKFFPTVPSKKRSRLEGFSGERHGNPLSNDRPVMGPGLGKMGIQNQAISSSTGFEQQKSGERIRRAVPSKRTRTSLADKRNSAQMKPSGVVDRDREMSRPSISGPVPAEDRTMSIGVDGWEKTKLKKKRSGIKPDITSTSKPADGYREPKTGFQCRPVADSRSRLNSDSHVFRLGVANGAVGAGKPDSGAQPTGLSVRPTVSKADLEDGSLLNDKKERPAGSDKDKVNLKAVNKGSVHDEFNSASPTSSTKTNVSVRAPRSNTGVGPKLSPTLHRATAPNEWELSHCANKPAVLVANNRKRTASARASSPPVAHWAGQRPQKISRTARRTNLTPIVSNNDETATWDAVSDVSGSEPGLPKRLSTSSPQQVKLKGEPSAAALSESEESGTPEIRSKEKGKQSEEADEKVVHNLQKLPTLAMPPRKSKISIGEELGDGVKKGRSGRGFASTRAPVLVGDDKLGNVGTAKQLKHVRHGFGKSESKPGRPPTRKLSDRKAYPRKKHSMVNATPDFFVDPDDGNKDLLAAANAAISVTSGPAVPNAFWRKMDPFFSFISDDDIAFLKQQGNVELPSPISSDVNDSIIFHNGNGSFDDARDGESLREVSSSENPQKLVPGPTNISLFQRLLTAIIPEEDCFQGGEDLKDDGYGTGTELDEELKSNALNNIDNFQYSGYTLNGHQPTGQSEHDAVRAGVFEIPSISANSTFCPSANGFLADQASTPSTLYSEFNYSDLQIDEMLQTEFQNLGILIEPMPNQNIEDGGISKEISNLEDKLREQTMKKKGLVEKLLQSASKAKELQEKEFETRAYDQLVTMAYEKYMACRGSHASGGKSSSSKQAKQASLAFVKRTLKQCHRFEDTGKSCFSEPLFREMFLKRCSRRSSTLLDTSTDGESSKLYDNNLTRSLDGRAVMGSQPSPRTSRFSQRRENYVTDSPEVLPHVANHLPEHDTSTDDLWSHKMKQRELLLDDVGSGMACNSPAGGFGGHLSSSTKGKRSERDREGKGHNRDAASRGGTNKIGRPTLSTAKGERKTKTKPKQKTAQLSVSVNGPVVKIPEHPKPVLPSEPTSSGTNTGSSNRKEKQGLGLDGLDDLSDLLGIDGDGQGNDLGSWLNIDDEALQDHDDFMGGLEIPMDDLSDLNMIV